MTDARRPVCDVAGCDAVATASYLQATDARAVEFAVCDAHFAAMRAGTRPTVVTEPSDPDGEPVLLLEPGGGTP